MKQITKSLAVPNYTPQVIIDNLKGQHISLNEQQKSKRFADLKKLREKLSGTAVVETPTNPNKLDSKDVICMSLAQRQRLSA